jgi:DNA repair protein RadC
MESPLTLVSKIRVSLVKEAFDVKPHQITCPTDAIPLLEEAACSDRECFLCLHLDARNQVIAVETVSIGSLNASLVHPRECFTAAIINKAASVILAHNHPSGDPTPSREDIDLTRRMQQAGDILGIEILDHIIITPQKRILSLKEANLF